MPNTYQITWKDDTIEDVVCDAMQQQGTTVLFLSLSGIQNAEGQTNGDIILAANFNEMKCFRKLETQPGGPIRLA